MLRFYLQVALLLFVAVYAFRKGGGPERHVALILTGMLVAVIVRAAIVGGWSQFDGVPWFKIALDVIALALILAIALRADRWWPLCVASVQLLSVLAHLLRIVDADLPPLAYAIMERWPYMIAIVITGLGTYLHHRRNRTVSPN